MSTEHNILAIKNTSYTLAINFEYCTIICQHLLEMKDAALKYLCFFFQ